MTGITSFYSSSTATASMLRAFKYQSQASMLQGLSFFSGEDAFDTVSFSRQALDSSFVMSIIQAGNSAIFGGIYKDAADFNQNLMSSVASSAGFDFGFGDSIMGQLLDSVG